MKLLFDQNLSPGLVDKLADVFPDSKHVRTVGLREGEDIEIWSYAQLQSLMIVQKTAIFLK